MVAFEVTVKMKNRLALINNKYKHKPDKKDYYQHELLKFSVEHAPKSLTHLWMIDKQGQQESAAWERWVYKDTPWKEQTEREYNKVFNITK